VLPEAQPDVWAGDTSGVSTNTAVSKPECSPETMGSALNTMLVGIIALKAPDVSIGVILGEPTVIGGSV